MDKQELHDYITNRLLDKTYGKRTDRKPLRAPEPDYLSKRLDEIAPNPTEELANKSLVSSDNAYPFEVPENLPKNPKNLAEQIGEANAAWVAGFKNSAYYQDFGLEPTNEGQYKLLWRYESANPDERAAMRNQWSNWVQNEKINRAASKGEEKLRNALREQMAAPNPETGEQGEVDEEWIDQEVARQWRKDPISIIGLADLSPSERNEITRELNERQRAEQVYSQAFKSASQDMEKSGAAGAIWKSAGMLAYDMAVLGYKGLNFIDSFGVAVASGFKTEQGGVIPDTDTPFGEDVDMAVKGAASAAYEKHPIASTLPDLAFALIPAGKAASVGGKLMTELSGASRALVARPFARKFAAFAGGFAGSEIAVDALAGARGVAQGGVEGGIQSFFGEIEDLAKGAMDLGALAESYLFGKPPPRLNRDDWLNVGFLLADLAFGGLELTGAQRQLAMDAARLKFAKNRSERIGHIRKVREQAVADFTKTYTDSIRNAFAEELVRAEKMGVDPELPAQLARTNMNTMDVVNLLHRIDPKFGEAVRNAYGFPPPDFTNFISTVEPITPEQRGLKTFDPQGRLFGATDVDGRVIEIPGQEIHKQVEGPREKQTKAAIEALQIQREVAAESLRRSTTDPEQAQIAIDNDPNIKRIDDAIRRAERRLKDYTNRRVKTGDDKRPRPPSETKAKEATARKRAEEQRVQKIEELRAKSPTEIDPEERRQLYMMERGKDQLTAIDRVNAHREHGKEIVQTIRQGQYPTAKYFNALPNATVRQVARDLGIEYKDRSNQDILKEIHKKGARGQITPEVPAAPKPVAPKPEPTPAPKAPPARAPEPKPVETPKAPEPPKPTGVPKDRGTFDPVKRAKEVISVKGLQNIGDLADKAASKTGEGVGPFRGGGFRAAIDVAIENVKKNRQKIVPKVYNDGKFRIVVDDVIITFDNNRLESGEVVIEREGREVRQRFPEDELRDYIVEDDDMDATVDGDFVKFMDADKGERGSAISAKARTEAEASLREAKGAEQSMVEMASTQAYTDGTELGGWKDLPGLWLSDLVDLGKQLAEALVVSVPPGTRKNEVLGAFFSAGANRGKIFLNPEIFKVPDLASRVLAHEIGHLIDWLPDKIRGIPRGDILDRLASLAYDKNRGFTRELDGVKNKTVRDEGWALSRYWRPFPNNVPKKYLEYRLGSKEIYADFISALLLNPNKVKEMAPTMFDLFMKHLDRKPEVLEAFEALASRLRGMDSKMRAAMLMEKQVKGFKFSAESLLERIMVRDAANERSFILQIQENFIDRYQTILNLRGKVAENLNVNKNELPTYVDPRYLVDDLQYAGTKAYKIAAEVRADVDLPLREIGVTTEDFGAFLLNRRILYGDRSEYANPDGVDPKAAKMILENMKDRLGDARWKHLQKIGKRFSDIIFQSIEDAYESGTIDQSMYELALGNKDYYATFVTWKHHDTVLSPQIKAQKGTFEKVANPYLTTVMKAMAISRHAAINSAKKDILNVLRLADQHVSERKPVGKMGEPSVRDAARFGHVVVYEKGKLFYVEVDKYIAETMRNDMPTSTANVLRIANQIIYKPMHPLLVTYNPAFGLRQLVRDFHQLYVRMPGYNPWRILKYTKSSAREAARWAFKGKPGALLKDMLDNSAIDDTFMTNITEDPNTMFGYDGPGDIGRMAGLGFDTDLLQKDVKAAKYIKMGKDRAGLLARGLDKIARFNFFTEAMPKMMAYQYALDLGVGKRKAAYMARTYAGTPKFKRGGYSVRWMNNLMMYSNVAIQGWRADIEIATGNSAVPTTMSGWWVKQVITSIAPKIALRGAALGWFGSDVQEWAESLNEYEASQFFTFPIARVDDPESITGKSWVNITLPYYETGRAMSLASWITSGVIADAIDAAFFDDSSPDNVKGGTFLDKAMRIPGEVKGQFPGLSPVLDVTGAWLDYIAGTNYFDKFRGRPIVPRNDFEAGGVPRLAGVIRWTAQQTGVLRPVTEGAVDLLGNFHAAFARYDDKAGTWLTLVDRYALGPNALFAVSNYGYREKQRLQFEQAQSQKAQLRASFPPSIKRANQKISYYRGLRGADTPLTPTQQAEYDRLRGFDRAYRRILEILQNTDDKKERKELIDQLDQMAKEAMEK